jgi:C4-dicarboxylate transporter DctM subunit
MFIQGGCFMEQIAILLIALPTLMPIIKALHFDPIWFGVIMLINLEKALTTPPFGSILFVIKGVSPRDVAMREIYSSS